MKTFASLVLALSITGCGDMVGSIGEAAPPTGVAPPSEPLNPGNTATPQEPVDTPPEVGDPELDPTHGQWGTSIPVGLSPEDESPLFIRSRRRMNLEQLQAQIAHATGGRSWTVNGKEQFEELAATLGRPDYISTLTEDLSAGPVFQKFLGDAARSICTDMADEEPSMPLEERVLMVEASADDTLQGAPEEVEANLARLMLRFHGLAVEHGAPVLSKYRWLFQSVVHTTGSPAQGWRLVCIALMSHPAFYSY